MSCKKKDTMSCGTCSTQTDKGKECLALWAKACAIALPYRTTWEKEILWKEFFKVEMSWMRWPPYANSQPPSWIALITEAESPSSTTRVVFVSREKVIARLAASNSSTSTVGGFFIFLDRVALTSPLPSQITTPIPASSNSPNIVPSKFIFHTSSTGGHHLRGAMRTNAKGILVRFLKSQM